jgi:hypothetical protein
MHQEEAKAILKQAFSALNDKELENFRHHLKREIPVWSGVPKVKELYFSEHEEQNRTEASLSLSIIDYRFSLSLKHKCRC